MFKWFNYLESREQRTLLLGSIFLVIMLGYFLVWQPLAESQARLKQIVAAQQQTLGWMQTTALEIRRAKAQKSALSLAQQSSLLSLIDNTVQQSALSTTDKRLEPQGDNEVKVNFEQVNFTEMIRWLSLLYNQYQINVENIQIERQRSPDTVKAYLTLKR